MSSYLLRSLGQAIWFTVVGAYVITVAWVAIAIVVIKYAAIVLAVVLAITIPVGVLGSLPPAIIIGVLFIGGVFVGPWLARITANLMEGWKETA